MSAPANPLIRPEQPGDAAAIAAVISAAFAASAHGNHGEAALVDRLRTAAALSLSLVAAQEGHILGHAAISPVSIDNGPDGWFGLGPVAVLPAFQGCGIGHALIVAGLDLLRADGAAGCVVLGNPAYYGRFGFRANPQLRYANLPPGPFQRLCFAGPPPAGNVRYHPAFGG